MITRTVVLTAFLTVSLYGNINYAAFILTPETAIVFLNSQSVYYNCATNFEPGVIIWMVDGMEARLIQNQGIQLNYSGYTMSSLIITPSAENNNTEILCTEWDLITGIELNRTQPAYLYIQGHLASPTNLFIEHTTDMTIHLRWTPPYTLNVTNTDQEILYYEVIISAVADHNVNSETTTLPEHVYHRQDYLHCKRLKFQVAAVNDVGRGNISEMITAYFSGSVVMANPQNMTVEIGEWAELSCDIIYDSSMEFILWFIDDFTLSSLEINPDLGFTFLQSSITPFANHTFTSRHSLSIQPNMHRSTAVFYCAIISVCSRDASANENCTPSMCYSEAAHIEVIVRSRTPINGSDSWDYPTPKIFSQNSGPLHHLSCRQNQLILGIAIGLGAVLLGMTAVMFVGIIIIFNYRKQVCSKSKIINKQEPVYDFPNVVKSETKDVTLKLYDQSIKIPSPPKSPVEMTPCPAYQTPHFK